MSGYTGGRRLLLVHAHPDDESIWTGGIMAKYAAEGAHVTLVTCTLGELGEVIPAALDYLRAERGDGLGAYRTGELAAACAALGVTDHRFLGGAGRWRDSGMMGTPANDDPGCFWRADLDVAAAELTGVIRAVRPQVIVTYDRGGGYGHPDHIQAHRVAWRAFERSAGQEWQVAKFYAYTVPRGVLADAVETVRAADTSFCLPGSAADLPYGVPDEQVTTEIDVTAYLGAKLAAMRAHATQVSVDGAFFALSNNVGQLALGTEYVTLLAGPRGKGTGPADREEDLFAALP
ncbi:MAG TPA: N-acetyl-1-D-myo-inositol-2-amino-2-deoxy-alpha-D-glucopyranoside deacetylase [Streptosporangiaceae bacterium]|nr:N-acetyl-1-D-myo-inositol-2-amino-2-deoxy-alpha-D-glucopyranoside deacetylase [Streptosporangiaceae bacterium]